MILNTCRELIFFSATPHPKIPSAPTSVLSLLEFSLSKVPNRRKPPPCNTSQEEEMLVSLVLQMSEVVLMDRSPSEQLLSIAAGGADRLSCSLLHIWLTAPAFGSESAWIFAVCRLV